MRTLLIILLAFVGMTATLLGMLLIAYPVLTAYGMQVYLNYAICSLLIVLLSWQLKGKWAV